MEIKSSTNNEQKLFNETASDTKSQLREAFRPSEETTKKIQTRVEQTALDILGKDNNPEIKRVLETAVGIFLWKEGVLDLGQALPAGLLYKKSKQFGDGVVFDRTKISSAQYGFVIDRLEKTGGLDEIKDLKGQDRKERRAEQVTAMENYLKDSPLTDFLGSFQVTPQKQLAERDLSSLEETRQRGNLEKPFRNVDNLGQARRLDPQLQNAYQTLVEKPLSMATAEDYTKGPSDKRDKNPARTVFREFIIKSYSRYNFSYSSPREADTLRKALTVKDGEFLLHYADGEWDDYDEVAMKTFPGKGEKNKKPHDFEYFTSDCIIPLNKDPHRFNEYYSSLALAWIAPKLYDRSDHRSFQEIVDEGIKEAAERFIDESERQEYRLDGRKWFNKDQMMLWLNNSIGPQVKTDSKIEYDAKINPTRGNAKDYTDIETKKEKEQAIRPGRTLYSEPDVETMPRRIIHMREEKRAEVPNLPSESPDLIIDLYQANDGEPEVEGMKLTARDGSRLYFQVDHEAEQLYQPVEKLVPAFDKMLAAEVCHEMQMDTLAEKITSEEAVTYAQLMTIFKSHFRYYEAGMSFEENDGWRKDAEGNLLGDSKVFNQFLQTVLNRVYGSKFVQTVEGRAVQNGTMIDGETFYKTKLSIPSEGIDWVIDIAPDAPYPSPDEEDEMVPFSVIREAKSSDEKVTTPPFPIRVEREESPHSQYLSELKNKKWEREQEKKRLEETPIDPEIQQMLLDLLNEKKSSVTSDTPNLQAEKLDLPLDEAAQGNLGTLLDKAKTPEQKLETQREQQPKISKKENTLLHDSLSIENAKEMEQMKGTTMAEVQFVEPAVFADVNQRLITSVPRKDNLPTPFAIEFDEMDALLSFSDEKGIIDGESDPCIEGLLLVARDDETRDYGFKIDPESTIYKPVLEEIPPDKLLDIVAICEKAGMSSLAADLNTGQPVTIDQLRLALQKYSSPWIPEGEGKPSFPVESILDLAKNGLIVDDQVRGQCDTFEFAMRDLLRIADPQTPLSKQIGYSFMKDRGIVDAQLHAQTKRKEQLIDVEPPSLPPTFKNEPTEQDLADLASLSNTPTEEILDKITAELQHIAEGKMPETTALTIPQPESIEVDQKEMETEQRRKELVGSVALFKLELATYLDIKGNFLDYTQLKSQADRLLGLEIRKSASHTNAPHIQLWRIVDKYHQWIKQEQPDSSSFPIPQSIDQIQKWVNLYKKNEPALKMMVKQKKIPGYDARFVQTMDEMVKALLQQEKQPIT